MKQNLTILLFTFFAFVATAQKIKFPVIQIADSLLTNSNAVVRLNHQEISISSQRKMTITTNRVVTVYNKNGLSAVGAVTGYDKSRSLNAIEAVVYDTFGNEIKKIRKKDFIDESAVSGGTLFSDSRVVYLNYTPISYPFTVNFTCEIQTSNTALIPKWMPITDFYVKTSPDPFTATRGKQNSAK